jgi:hydroxyquinol 1,2-dioxygenase
LADGSVAIATALTPRGVERGVCFERPQSNRPIIARPTAGDKTVMRNLDEDTITDAVLARHAHADDERLKTIVTSLVRHLHAFAREETDSPSARP